MQKKKEYITILSLLSCVAVVYLHVNGVFWTFSYSSTWITANIIESIFYFAVPIFFMITGVTLIDYRDKYDTKTYFKKRITKVFIPYIIWSIFYIICNCVMTKSFSSKLIVENLLQGTGGAYFWFFIPLFAIYIIIPIISLIPKEKRKTIFAYILAIGFLTVSVLPFLFRILGIEFNNYFSIFSCTYVLYSIGGYYIENYEISKKYRCLIYLLGILGLLLHLIGTNILSYNDGSINELFKGYQNFPCVLYSVSIFVFFKYYFKNRKEVVKTTGSKIINFFSPTTFGVYLIQQTVISVAEMIIDKSGVLYRIFGAFAIFLICALIVKMIQKIPIINKIVPK